MNPFYRTFDFQIFCLIFWSKSQRAISIKKHNTIKSSYLRIHLKSYFYFVAPSLNGWPTKVEKSNFSPQDKSNHVGQWHSISFFSGKKGLDALLIFHQFNCAFVGGRHLIKKMYFPKEVQWSFLLFFG